MKNVQMTSAVNTALVLNRNQIKKKKDSKCWGWPGIFSVIGRNFFFP